LHLHAGHIPETTSGGKAGIEVERQSAIENNNSTGELKIKKPRCG